MTVLIVDDEIALRDTLRDAFEDEGFEVAVASNGREALERLAGEQIRAVVLDLVMPVMGGAEVIEAMGKDPRLAAIPVVVVTSDPTRAPAGHVTFQKPLKLDVLIDAVARLSGAKP